MVTCGVQCPLCTLKDGFKKRKTLVYYLVDELCHTNHVALSIKDRQAEHGLGNKAVLIL